MAPGTVAADIVRVMYVVKIQLLKMLRLTQQVVFMLGLTFATFFTHSYNLQLLKPDGIRAQVHNIFKAPGDNIFPAVLFDVTLKFYLVV